MGWISASFLDMGRKLSQSDEDQHELIHPSKIAIKAAKVKHERLNGAIWTHRKALLIQTYLQLFAYITKRGTYIDAFAGPQDGCRESNTWAARRIWEKNPGAKKRRIDKFEFFELSGSSHAHLLAMLHATPSDGRKFHVSKGDCNVKLPKRLEASPVKGPAFCLLDQRSDECDWATVEAIARHKADPNKIEIFYFVMAGWYDRYRAGLGPDRDKKLLKWWGASNFPILDKASPDRAAELFAERFRAEFGYKHVVPFPIFDNVSPATSGTVKFYMIHASDHDDAPKLMKRAYKRLAAGWNPDIVQEGMDFLEGDLSAMLTGVGAWDKCFTAEEKIARAKRRSAG
jgi:three-Cys-motif partner protein